MFLPWSRETWETTGASSLLVFTCQRHGLSFILEYVNKVWILGWQRWCLLPEQRQSLLTDLKVQNRAFPYGTNRIHSIIKFPTQDRSYSSITRYIIHAGIFLTPSLLAPQKVRITQTKQIWLLFILCLIDCFVFNMGDSSFLKKYETMVEPYVGLQVQWVTFQNH